MTTSKKKESIKDFKGQIERYKQIFLPDSYPAPKCLSDQGMIWLRFGLWSLKNYQGRNVLVLAEKMEKERNGEKFEDFCVRIYNEMIRGNMDYTNKPMVPSVAALLYAACNVYNLGMTQREIAEIYCTREHTVRNHYKEFLIYMMNSDVSKPL